MIVGKPITTTPPWPVMSPIRAAGMPPIIVVKLPIAIMSGPPAHTAGSQTRAAGIPPIITVTAPGGMIGPPTCRTTPVHIGAALRAVGGGARFRAPPTAGGPPAAGRFGRGGRAPPRAPFAGPAFGNVDAVVNRQLVKLHQPLRMERGGQKNSTR